MATLNGLCPASVNICHPRPCGICASRIHHGDHQIFARTLLPYRGIPCSGAPRACRNLVLFSGILGWEKESSAEVSDVCGHVFWRRERPPGERTPRMGMIRLPVVFVFIPQWTFLPDPTNMIISHVQRHIYFNAALNS